LSAKAFAKAFASGAGSDARKTSMVATKPRSTLANVLVEVEANSARTNDMASRLAQVEKLVQSMHEMMTSAHSTGGSMQLVNDMSA
jgi:hypothetical protein